MVGTAATLDPSVAQPQADVGECGAEDGPAGFRTAADHRDVDSRRRPLRTVGLVAVIVGLTAGLLSLAGVGFVTLRDDMRAIDAKIDAQVGMLRDDMRAVDAKIDAQVGTLRDDVRAVDAKIDAQVGMLRDDMRAVDAKIDTQVGTLRDEIAQMRADMNQGFAQVDDRFAGVNAVLLNHTDRLARIEALHSAPPHP